MTAKAGLVSVLFSLTFTSLALAGDAAAIPVYQFKPGQILTYHSTSQFKYGEGDKAGEHGTTADYTVWVARLNPDGSYRLIIRGKDVFYQTFKGKKTDQPARTSLVYADVFPDGKVLPNKSIQYQGNPATLFPSLPHDAAQLEAGWKTEADGDRVTCKMLSTKDKPTFESVKETVFDKIYLSSHKSKYTFDPAKGFIVKDESESTQGYGFVGKGTGKMELVSIAQMEPAALKEFTDSTDKYFKASDAYEEKTEALTKTAPEKVKELLKTAVAGLKAAAADMKNEELKAALSAKVTESDRMTSYYVSQATQRAKVMGKPAAAFETKEIDGKTVKLADLKGQVVVLDFWYRGCGWCVKAMPQMNQLAEDFAGKPVAIFGMNTDRNEKDAKFVIEKMGLKYPTLKAEGLPERFGVQGFPTLIIIDPQGNVHDIHVGYSPTLREEVGKQIKALLTKL